MQASDFRTAAFLSTGLMWRGSRAILALTPIIIGLAIANLVFFDGLFGGLFKAVDRMVLNTLFSNIVIEPEENHKYIVSADQMVAAIQGMPGVTGVAPHYKSRLKLVLDRDHDNRDVRQGDYPVVSVEVEKERGIMIIPDRIVAGRYLNENDRDAIVIGNEVAGGPTAFFPKIGLGGAKVGDRLTAVYPNGVTRQYTVVGIYRTGHDASDASVYVTHKEIESVLGVRDMANEIMVRTTEGAEPGVVAAIRRAGYTKEKITAWTEFLNYLATMTRSFDFLKVVTSLVAMIVVNVTVFIVMFINVMSRQRQLGILRAIGLGEDTVILSFVMQTALYCLAGFAVMGALVFGVIVPYIVAHPLDVGFGSFVLEISGTDVATATALVFGTNLLACWVPAWAVTRRPIIKAIWGT